VGERLSAVNHWAHSLECGPLSLVAAALTLPHARRAQPAPSLRRFRIGFFRVTIANDPAAAAARRETR